MNQYEELLAHLEQNGKSLYRRLPNSDGVILHKQVWTEVEHKEIDRNELIVPFIISTAREDRDGDTIAVNGWQLENYRKNPVVLWAHDHRSPPVAKALSTIVEGKNLKAVAQFTKQEISPFGYMIFQMYAEGFLKATSVGFIPLEWKFREGEEGGRRGVDFIKQELLEFSTVPVPANPDALAAAAGKGIDLAPLKDWAEEVLDKFDEHTGLILPRKRVEQIRTAVIGDKTYTITPEQQDAILRRNLDAVRAHGHVTIDDIGIATLHYDKNRIVPEKDEIIELIDDEVDKPRTGRQGPGSGKTGIQTVIFMKDNDWTVQTAKKWCKDHDFYQTPVDETDASIRIRQFDPGHCREGSFQTLTQNLPAGIRLVQCTGKSKYGPVCSVEAYEAALKSAEADVYQVDVGNMPKFDPGIEIVEDNKQAITWSQAHRDGTTVAPRDSDWSAAREVASASITDLFVICAWHADKSKDELSKSDFKFPHHRAADRAVVWRGVVGAMASLLGRGGSDIPASDRRGVYNHLARHYRVNFDVDPPEFRHVEEQTLKDAEEVFGSDVIENEGWKFHLDTGQLEKKPETILRLDDPVESSEHEAFFRRLDAEMSGLTEVIEQQFSQLYRDLAKSSREMIKRQVEETIVDTVAERFAEHGSSLEINIDKRLLDGETKTREALLEIVDRVDGKLLDVSSRSDKATENLAEVVDQKVKVLVDQVVQDLAGKHGQLAEEVDRRVEDLIKGALANLKSEHLALTEEVDRKVSSTLANLETRLVDAVERRMTEQLRSINDRFTSHFEHLEERFKSVMVDQLAKTRVAVSDRMTEAESVLAELKERQDQVLREVKPLLVRIASKQEKFFDESDRGQVASMVEELKETIHDLSNTLEELVEASKPPTFQIEGDMPQANGGGKEPKFEIKKDDVAVAVKEVLGGRVDELVQDSLRRVQGKVD